jgi:ornithine carbamoyltransferase
MTEKIQHFIDLDSFSKKDFRSLLDSCHDRKNSKIRHGKAEVDTDACAEHKILAMIFEKPSTRTRLSFELAMKQLGGKILVLNPKESHYGSGDESIYDTAKVLSQYGDSISASVSTNSSIVFITSSICSCITPSI